MKVVSIQSSARFVRTAPDKIRLLAGLIKKKNLDKALEQMQFAGKYAATPLSLVLKQLKAQIKDQGLVETDYLIKEVRIDEGPKLKRRQFRSKGRATAILKRMSHITIIMNNEENQKSNIKDQNDKAKKDKNVKK